MNDTSNRLTKALDVIKNLPPGDFLPSPAAKDISQEIARLTKANAELREVLRTIRTWHKGNGIAEGVIDQALANSSEGE